MTTEQMDWLDDHAAVRPRRMGDRPPDTPAEAAVRTLLEHVGEDPQREGLRDTPGRVARAWTEMTCGYRLDPVDILRSALFTEPGADQLVVAGPFEFTSLCEHHCLPFAGVAVVGYVPADGRITGLSKLPRAVLALAQRLQVQERLTAEIADAIETALHPQGVGVVLTAVHSCAELRGVKTRTPFTTSDMRGCLRNEQAARAELLAVAGRQW